MTRLATERLLLRCLEPQDAAFFLELTGEPAWLEYIPDKGLRSVEEAREYLVREPIALFERVGFSLYAVTPRAGGEPLGICGLVQRDELEDPDLGFAFLTRHCRKGYAYEASVRVLEHARRDLGLTRVVALTDWANHASRSLLEKLGFALEGGHRMADEDEEIALFALALA